MMSGGISGVLTTISFEIATPFASEIGTSAPGPTTARGDVGSVLVWWFRRLTPPKLGKKKSEECPKSWGSKDWKTGDNNSVQPMQVGHHIRWSDVLKNHPSNEGKEWQ